MPSARREALEKRRNSLMHEYGASPFRDGLVRDEIARIDAALSVPEQEGGRPGSPGLSEAKDTPTSPNAREAALRGIEAHIHELCCRVSDDNPLKDRIHAARDYLARALLSPGVEDEK